MCSTHSLIRIAGAQSLSAESEQLPAWVTQSLQRAPWVVVRRAKMRDRHIPVGIRGTHRQERFPAWVASVQILENATPQQLASRQAWRSANPTDRPALCILDTVELIMETHGFGAAWGPAGSVGFELVSGCATVTASSDLDLILAMDTPLLSAKRDHFRKEKARSLHRALSQLPVRTDVLLEFPEGAVALAEYVSASDSLALRTVDGPRLLSSSELCA
jgi:phosphoribosyl-dephospho-CoA transferase